MVVSLDYRRLVKRVAERAEVPDYVVADVIEQLGMEVCETLAKGIRVKVDGLGAWKPVHRQVRARGDVGDICFMPLRWKLNFAPCPMMKRAIDVLPVKYKKMRCVSGRRIDDLRLKYNTRKSMEPGTVNAGQRIVWREEKGDEG